MTAKILLQEIWRSGADWDDPLPPTLLDIWTAWAKDLSLISSITIPRCFRLQEKPLYFELHVFSDASELAFSACVYLRAKYANGIFGLNLLLAKARVSPLRQLSIPRLELQGAVLGVRLCDSAIKEIGPIASQVIYWCDSQTVLQWIHSKSCKYHAFVAHRITEILDSSAASQWRHVPGEMNPADDCSRGIPATHLITQHRWFRGPDFLALPRSSWPSTGVIVEPSSDNPEVSPVKWVGHIQVINDHPVFNLIPNSSNLHKLKRIVAWLLRFVNNRQIYPNNQQCAPYVKAPKLCDFSSLYNPRRSTPFLRQRFLMFDQRTAGLNSVFTIQSHTILGCPKSYPGWWKAPARVSSGRHQTSNCVVLRQPTFNNGLLEIPEPEPDGSETYN